MAVFQLQVDPRQPLACLDLLADVAPCAVIADERAIAIERGISVDAMVGNGSIGTQPLPAEVPERTSCREVGLVRRPTRLAHGRIGQFPARLADRMPPIQPIGCDP